MGAGAEIMQNAVAVLQRAALKQEPVAGSA